MKPFRSCAMRAVFFIFFTALATSGCGDDGRFTDTGPMNDPRHGHTATNLGASRILIAAGLTKTNPLGTIEFFAAAEGIFKALPVPGLHPRGWHRATRLRDGVVLLTGGWAHPNKALREAAIILSTGGAPTRIYMAAARFDHTATLLKNGNVLITGGNDGKRAIRGLEIFSSHSKTFTPAARPMYLTRQQHTATLLPDGRVLIAGGNLGDGARYAEIYEPAIRQTALVRGTYFVPRSRHTATYIPTGTGRPSGQVLLAGGIGPKGTLSTAELYDPTTETVHLLNNSMIAPRQQHTATLLPDGRVLIIGGWGAGKSLASGEIYDPVGGCFIPLDSPMSYGRRLHTATLIDVGHVLIAGGASDREVLSLAEMFEVPSRGNGCKK